MSESGGGNAGQVEPANNGQVAQEAGADNAAAARQPSKWESFMAMAKSLLLRAMIIYFVTSFFRKPAAPQNTTGTGPVQSQVLAQNIFANGTEYSLHVYISEEEEFMDFNPSKLFWLQEGLVYGDWYGGPLKDGTFSHEKDIPITDHLQNNGSLYLHCYVTKFGESPDPKSKIFGKTHISFTSKAINRYKKIKASGRKNLLTGESEGPGLEEGKIISHWHPNLTINIVTDYTQWNYGNVPPPLNEYVKFINDGKMYKPVVFLNDYWNMAKDYKPLNETLSLQLTLQPLSLFKWQIYAAQKMKKQFNFFGDTETEDSDEEQDTLKETLLETNPYLLGVTFVVSILHSIFELLAFKNDIQFWNNRNTLEGLSVRSVFFGVFQSLIVLLYVLDNDTNTVVKISCFVGLCIELWKIQKVIDIKFQNGRLSFKDKGSYVESSTRQYDELAFKYLSWICFPLLACYSGYALFYMEHKGWYSFVLSLFYGYLLTFGFIMMTPQLFINYKLKSVAHLPWRMLTYKFLNTFIDDMFAFVIKMPTMYRIGCFRDDIIFLVFLYQRWMYRVDKTRMNEFGFAAEPVNAVENTQQQIEAKPVEGEKETTANENIEENKKTK
ncbi:PREDICTED: cleft lip and palate transmembrane protein 1 [Nicrophorus vespilloides]|uniref:Cleft lip and palate transmembrane protein 1 n=1 Tax=Nicrophorus vespilloides TaxID=110193 RepID=A0ABM1M353_NICVS|nr:PREDICTED: cleft lip and palate transmembrane protein 1 [Nicrophorus vespilloides]